jgi:acetyl-CoA carboxylase biotin carboxyl carrier protein
MKPQDIADLKQLIEFLKEHQVAEFDLERDGLKIRIKLNQAEASAPGLDDLARLLRTAPPSVAQAAEPDLHLLKSPIVGTFYSSPTPGAALFVSAGDRVAKGQVVAVVEAMKLMNEIESDVAGEIVKCLVSNGGPIEFGQPLFSIRLG